MGLFNKKPASIDTGNLVNNFINKSEGLTRILEKETEYFKDMKVKQAEMLAETKNTLIDEIADIKVSLTTRPETLAALPVSEKVRLKQANITLMVAAEENYKETQKAQEVNKLILEAISYAVNQHAHIEGAYGDKGDANKNNVNKPISVIATA